MLCDALKDGIPLVNIVNEKMSPGDMKLLKEIGAKYVVLNMHQTKTQSLHRSFNMMEVGPIRINKA